MPSSGGLPLAQAGRCPAHLLCCRGREDLAHSTIKPRCTHPGHHGIVLLPQLLKELLIGWSGRRVPRLRGQHGHSRTTAFDDPGHLTLCSPAGQTAPYEKRYRRIRGDSLLAADLPDVYAIAPGSYIPSKAGYRHPHNLGQVGVTGPSRRGGVREFRHGTILARVASIALTAGFACSASIAPIASLALMSGPVSLSGARHVYGRVRRPGSRPV
jgi:hypothetical protein